MNTANNSRPGRDGQEFESEKERDRVRERERENWRIRDPEEPINGGLSPVNPAGVIFGELGAKSGQFLVKTMGLGEIGEQERNEKRLKNNIEIK